MNNFFKFQLILYLLAFAIYFFIEVQDNLMIWVVIAMLADVFSTLMVTKHASILTASRFTEKLGITEGNDTLMYVAKFLSFPAAYLFLEYGINSSFIIYGGLLVTVWNLYVYWNLGK